MKTLFKMIIVICGVSLVFPFSSFAAQFDAPYYVLQEKNKDKWAAEDEQIDAKLAALEKKFGKKYQLFTSIIGRNTLLRSIA